MITLENKKMYDLIVSKDSLVNDGRKISRELEGIEIKIKRLEDKEKKITLKAEPPKDLVAKGDALVIEVTKLNTELTEIADKINKAKLDAIPKDLKEEHETLMKKRETLERDRNKLALKIQKIKDKLIPIVQREVKPLLTDRFDDIETAKAINGKVVISTFNHLEEFKSKFPR